VFREQEYRDAPGPERVAQHSRKWLDSGRMRVHMSFAGLGPVGTKPLLPYARAGACRLDSLILLLACSTCFLTR
jgi:hypothetical protein